MNIANPNPVVSVFTQDQVSRITGISQTRLRAWDRRGFFVPRYAYSDRSSAYSRIYSFKDVVGLRTIYILQTEYKLSLGKLEKVAEELESRGYQHWADTKLYFVNGKVHFRHRDSDKVESLHDGQFAMLPVIDVINDIKEKVVEIQRRKEEDKGRIERHKFIARNAWVVAGTRIPTASIRRYSEAGFTEEQILAEYPALSADDVRAALIHEKKLEKQA